MPTGLRKVLYFNWGLALLLVAVACAGFLMLYSVADGSFQPWAQPQMMRFAVGVVIMIAFGFVPIWYWAQHLGRGLSRLPRAFGGGGCRGLRSGWGRSAGSIFGFIMLQPSELMKITLVMLLAAYYDWLDVRRTSRPLWVLIPVILILIPTALVLKQPDLGTAMLLLLGGGRGDVHRRRQLVVFRRGSRRWAWAA